MGPGRPLGQVLVEEKVLSAEEKSQAREYEIFLSLQGESAFAGLPCVFVRLTACNLRCSYCDTAYAFNQGAKHDLSSVRAEIHRLAAPFSLRLSPLDLSLSHLRLPLVELPKAELVIEIEDDQ